MLPKAEETLPDFQVRSRRQARATLLPKRRQSPIRAQHDSIIQQPKTPRSKNGRTGTLEGRSGTSIYPTGTLGSAQLLLTRTQTHTRIRASARAQSVFHTLAQNPHRFWTNGTNSGRTVILTDKRAFPKMHPRFALKGPSIGSRTAAASGERSPPQTSRPKGAACLTSNNYKTHVPSETTAEPFPALSIASPPARSPRLFLAENSRRGELIWRSQIPPPSLSNAH